MDLGFQGKTAVVTGGSKGIGKAIARTFLDEGANVAICARNAEELKNTADELSAFGNVYAEVVDCTIEQQVYDFAQHIFEKFGSVDAWVNNVGASVFKKGEEFTDADLEFINAVCFKSAVFGSQAAYRYMKKTGGGIVNISSLAARCPTAGRSTLYGPMKAAINNLTQCLAGEYAAHGVRVNCVMPGFTATPAVKATIKQSELDYNARGTLLNRVAEPEEIAAPVVFLASEKASYMTGTTIEASGGRSITLNPTFAWDNLEKENG